MLETPKTTTSERTNERTTTESATWICCETADRMRSSSRLNSSKQPHAPHMHCVLAIRIRKRIRSNHAFRDLVVCERALARGRWRETRSKQQTYQSDENARHRFQIESLVAVFGFVASVNDDTDSNSKNAQKENDANTSRTRACSGPKPKYIRDECFERR